MKFNQQFIVTIFSLFLAADIANAQPQVTSSPENSLQQRDTEIERLRQDKEIRDRVQSEVDRAISYTTTLLNTLLLILILLPIVTGINLWLLRRSIIAQMASQAQEQLQITKNNLENELKEQLEVSRQQIELTTNENLQQIQNAIADIYNILAELRTEKGLIEQEIIKFRNAPVYHSDNTVSDIPIEYIQPENLESPVPLEDLSANDYLDQGNDYLAQGRYEEANNAYNEAVKIERDLPEARYQNARSYAMRRSLNLAIGNLQWAIDIDPGYKEVAKTDPAFNAIRNEEQFKNLLE